MSANYGQMAFIICAEMFWEWQIKKMKRQKYIEIHVSWSDMFCSQASKIILVAVIISLCLFRRASFEVSWKREKWRQNVAKWIRLKFSRIYQTQKNLHLIWDLLQLLLVLLLVLLHLEEESCVATSDHLVVLCPEMEKAYKIAQMNILAQKIALCVQHSDIWCPMIIVVRCHLI